jgi:NADH-quinone oxidoreductase subunit B
MPEAGTGARLDASKVEAMTHLAEHPESSSQPEVVINGVRMRLVDAPLACCALEVAAALGSLSEADASSGRAAALNVLLVSGTVTSKLAPAVRAMYDALPQPRRVLAFGACAVAGGPYWDSYSVENGASTQVPVDVFVPGCPPQPAALVEGLRTLTVGAV